MTSSDEYLRNISRNPEDNALRLLYANWLEDNGEIDFASFIRIQCELYDLQNEDERWLELSIEEESLWPRLIDRWFDFFRQLYFIDPFVKRTDFPNNTPVRVQIQPADFKRGLLDEAHITVNPDVYVQDSHRWIFLLGISNLATLGSPATANFFACPYLWRVRSLNCERSGVENDSLLGFTQAQHFQNLRHIDFYTNQIDSRGLTCLTLCPSLRNLETLVLDANPVRDDGLQILISSPICHKLQELSLSRTEITDAGARYFMESPHLKSLRYLNLTNNRLSSEVVEAIRLNLPSLEKLVWD